MEEASPQDLWMNHRRIDQEGLIIPYPRERQFNLYQCVNSLQSLLAKQQTQGLLNLHYAHHFYHTELVPLPFQTITYRGYLIGRCSHAPFDSQKDVKSQGFYFDYHIVRLSQYKSLYPYLLLFNIRMKPFVCLLCHSQHYPRIFKSSFEVVRAQFLMEIGNKIKFLEKHPDYNFQPFSFTSSRSHGLTPFLRLKYEDYESAEYFQKAEEILLNELRMHCLKESFDFQAVRLDEYLKEHSDVENNPKKKFIQESTAHELRVKIKYLCRKCKQKLIWTTKNTVIVRYQVVKLLKFPEQKGKVSYDNYPQFKEFVTKQMQAEKDSSIRLDKNYLKNFFKFDIEKLDKSISRKVEKYQQYQIYFQGLRGWHQSIQHYDHPFLVVISIEIPRVACVGCGKEKDGLVYVSNLLDMANTLISPAIINKVKKSVNKRVFVAKQ